MARAAAGKGRCAMCGEPVTWRKNDSGTLSYFCQDCDFQGYAKNGTLAHRYAMEEIEKCGGKKPEPSPKPAPAPATPPKKPADKSAGFGFFQE